MVEITVPYPGHQFGQRGRELFRKATAIIEYEYELIGRVLNQAYKEAKKDQKRREYFEMNFPRDLITGGLRRRRVPIYSWSIRLMHGSKLASSLKFFCMSDLIAAYNSALQQAGIEEEEVLKSHNQKLDYWQRQFLHNQDIGDAVLVHNLMEDARDEVEYYHLLLESPGDSVREMRHQAFLREPAVFQDRKEASYWRQIQRLLEYNPYKDPVIEFFHNFMDRAISLYEGLENP